MTTPTSQSIKPQPGSVQPGTLVRPRWLPSAGFWLLLPALSLVGGFFIVPLLWLVRVSFYSRPASNSSGGSRFYNPDTFTLDQYREILTDAYYIRIIGGTILQALLATGVIMLLAYPCAMIIHRFGSRLKSGLVLLVMLPKLTNLLVLTYGLLVMFSNSGVINQSLMRLGLINQPLPMFANLFAVIAAETVIIAPYPILILVSMFEGVDQALPKAAQGMGASPLRAFYETTFKLTLPGAIGGTLITFVWALGAYIGPVVMGNPDTYTTAVEVYRETFEYNNWPLGAALATSNVLLILALLAGYGLIQRSLKRSQRFRAAPAGEGRAD